MMRIPRCLTFTLATVVFTLCGLAANRGAAVACGHAASAWWEVATSVAPESLPPSGEGKITVLATDLGDREAGGAEPVTINDKLPPGMTVQSIAFYSPKFGGSAENLAPSLCTDAPLRCQFPYGVQPYETLEMQITVEIHGDPGPGVNEATVTGGGAQEARLRRQVAVNDSPASFGIEDYRFVPENDDGSVDTQAGSHPFQLTTTVALNQTSEVANGPALPKDVRVNWPPGLVGNPTVVPQCTEAQFDTVVRIGINGCAPETQVGVASVTFFAEPIHLRTLSVPLSNLQPTVGEPARFGFDVQNTLVTFDPSLRTGGDYGIKIDSNNISQLDTFLSIRATVWGVPGDPRHNTSRGPYCLGGEGEPCTEPGVEQQRPFLTLPTSCTGPLETSIEADSWPTIADPNGLSVGPLAPSVTSGLVGCNQEPFNPEIRVTPDGQAASTPTGLTVDVHIPQESTLDPTGLGESDLKGLSVTLPEGVALNPAGADGLEACTLEQIGLQNAEAASCPDASKIGTVTVRTPLLPNPVEGAAYLAEQNQNPFGSLVAMYIYVEDPVAGARAKAAGEVLENPVTGQITAHFEGDPVFEHDPRFAGDVAAQFLPQVPIEDVELHFFGGDRAPLVTPPACGAYTTTGSFLPWAGYEAADSHSTFDIVSGPKGSACPDPQPFSPTLAGGTTNIEAGGFSPFTMTMSREDGNQNLKGIQLHMPPGLLGTLSSVKPCGEPQADAGTCGPESLIGHTVVSVGLGGDPYSVSGGQVFLTGPYGGAPFGLSIVEPAKAGPFNLGTVVVRAKIEINPQTSALTVTTDESGPYAIPQILDGIPLQIKHVNVTVDRSSFTFNPTNCNPLAITGTLSSALGATDSLNVPFQVTNCATLAFKPKLSVSTSAHHNRPDGASLDVKLTYPNTPQGSEANIAKIKVQLPKRLPSRLTTLQKACTEAVFDANPASCPAASMVGEVTAKTPLLPVPVSGPAYFVSHGSAKFPELIFVLQGDNVVIQSRSETFISKQGITTATFNTVPDVPLSSVEVKLPEGPYSALAANGNLCKGTLTIPTEFVAQDAAKLKQNVKIAVTGCPKKVKHHKSTKKRKGK